MDGKINKNLSKTIPTGIKIQIIADIARNGPNGIYSSLFLVINLNVNIKIENIAAIKNDKSEISEIEYVPK